MRTGVGGDGCSEEDCRLDLSKLLESVAAASTDSEKFRQLESEISRLAGVERSEVTCKYVTDLRNAGNRFAEALHHGPRLIVIVEAEAGLVMQAFPPRLRRLARPPVTVAFGRTPDWGATCIIGGDSELVHRLVDVFPRASRVSLVSAEPDTSARQSSGEPPDLDALLAGVDLSGRDAHKFDLVRGQFAAYLGVEPMSVACKALTDSRNLYNRLGEVMHAAPAMMVLVVVGDADIARRAVARFHERSGMPIASTAFVARRAGRWQLACYVSPRDDPFAQLIGELAPAEIVSADELLATEDGQTLLSGAGDEENNDEESTNSYAEFEADTEGDTCEYCQQPLYRGLFASDSAFKSCPSCSRLNGRVHVFHAFPSRYGTSPRRVTLTNVSGAQSQCYHCRRNALASDGVKCSEITRTGKALRRARPEDWRSWDLRDWNTALLDDIFARDPSGGPVARIVSTPGHLRRISNSRETAEAVLEGFRDSIRRSLGGRSLLTDARDYGDWLPNAVGCRDSPCEPHFVVHLFVTCLVAAGYGPSPADSYHDRLRGFLGGAPGSTSGLPSLWEDLAKWLKLRGAQFGDVRALRLPDPSWKTHIGYSVGLSFPPRSDREHLSEFLFRDEWEGTEPPPREVLGTVRGRLQEFSPEFQDRFRLLEGKWEKDHSAFGDDPLWRVLVASATHRALEDADASDVDEFELVVEITESGFVPMLAVTKATALSPAFVAHSLDIDVEGCTASVARAGEPRDAGSDQVVREAFDGSLRVPRIAGYVRQGFVPLRLARPGYLMIARGEDVARAGHALVREDRVALVTERLGGSGFRSQIVPGWSEVTGLRPSIHEVAPLGLEDLWCLRPSASTFRIWPTAGTGIRLEGRAVLCDGQFLPTFCTSRQVSSVECRSADGDILQLEEDEAANWRFGTALPAPGEAVIAARDAAGHVLAELRMEFAAAVLSIDYRTPTESRFYWMEGSGGEKHVRGPDEPPLDPTRLMPGSPDLTVLTTDARYLGRDVGEIFATPRESVVWRATLRNGIPFLSRIAEAGVDDAPRSVVGPKNAARAYRRLLRHAVPGRDEDAALLSAYQAVARETAATRVPERVGFEGVCLRPLTESVLRPSTHPPAEARGVSRVRQVIAAMAYRRSGIPLSEIFDLFADVVHDAGSRWRTIRAWEECGAFDVLHRGDAASSLVFARRPRFVRWSSGGVRVATLAGLWLPGLLRDLWHAAAALGIALSVGESAAIVPLSIVATGFADDEALDRLAKCVGMEPPHTLPEASGFSDLRLDAEALRNAVHDGPPDPGYVLQPARGAAVAASITVEEFTHLRRPTLYAVARDGTAVGWSRSRNWARLHAAWLAGTRPFRRAGDCLTVDAASGVFLPMPLARVVAILSGRAPDPGVGENLYRYPDVTEAVLDTLVGGCPLLEATDE